MQLEWSSGFARVVAPGGLAFAAEPLDIFGSLAALPAGWRWQDAQQTVMRFDGPSIPVHPYSHNIAHDVLKGGGYVVEGSLDAAYLGQMATQAGGYNTKLPHGVLGIGGGDENLISLYDSTKVGVRINGTMYRQGTLWLTGNYSARWMFYGACVANGEAPAVAILAGKFGAGTKWLLAGHPMLSGFFGIPDGLVMWKVGTLWHGIADLRRMRAGLAQLCADTGADPATVIPPELTSDSLAQPLTFSISDVSLPAPADCFSKYSQVKGESEFESNKPFSDAGDDRPVSKIRTDVAASGPMTTFARFQAGRVFPGVITSSVVGTTLRWTIDGVGTNTADVDEEVADLEAALEDGAVCNWGVAKNNVNNAPITQSEKDFLLERIAYFEAIKPDKGMTAVQLAYDPADKDWSWFWCLGPKQGKDMSKLALYTVRAAFGLVDF